jgi:hypothetical protein
MTKGKETDFVSNERIAQSILSVRARRVLLDSELAILYGVATARLNQQVRRNLERFPGDFMFQLTADEHNSLMLQIATSKPGRGGRRKPPLVFTEHGALMAATLLNSPLAVEMSIYIVRAFVQLRDMVASNAELGQRVTKLERGHESLNGAVVGILKAIHRLQNVPETRAIGFFELDQKKK